jgi:hypothetical protein
MNEKEPNTSTVSASKIISGHKCLITLNFD